MQSHYPDMICPFDSAKLAEGKLVTNREKFGGHTLQSADKFISVIELCASGNVFPRSFGPGMIGSSAVMTELGRGPGHEGGIQRLPGVLVPQVLESQRPESKLRRMRPDLS